MISSRFDFLLEHDHQNPKNARIFYGGTALYKAACDLQYVAAKRNLIWTLRRYSGNVAATLLSTCASWRLVHSLCTLYRHL